MNERHIIGLVGFIGSGKDTVANYLQNKHGFARNSFAASLKDTLSAIFGWDRFLLEGVTPESRVWRETVDQWWAERLGIENFTPRYAMQTVGTDICRQHLHSDVWVSSLERKIANSTGNLVITDCRFENEITMLKRQGATIVWVCRSPMPEWYTELCAAMCYPTKSHMREHAIKKLGVHPSEVEWVGLDYNHLIYNNGSLEQLEEQVKNLVESLQAAT